MYWQLLFITQQSTTLCKEQHGFTFKSNRGTSNSLKAANLRLPFTPPWSEKAGASGSGVDQDASKSKTIPTADKVIHHKITINTHGYNCRSENVLNMICEALFS